MNKKISNFQELEEFVDSLKQDTESNNSDKGIYVSPIAFRGHSKASWNLDTTLERFGKKGLSLDHYVRYLVRVQPAIQSYTEKAFSFNRNNKTANAYDFIGSKVSFLEGQYEFMVYLRHHGFPTPLLDWSYSMYVALYFACSGADHDDDSALYMYVEHLGNGKGGALGSPEISTLGEYVSAHKRHFIQQSTYTACISKIKEEWCFHTHEDAIQTSYDASEDKIVKVLIPANLRSEFLRKLDSMNINAFSLFGTEDALMETLAFREMINFDL